MEANVRVLGGMKLCHGEVFAIAGLVRGNVTIANEQVVSKSYPRFWRTLDEVIAQSVPS